MKHWEKRKTSKEERNFQWHVGVKRETTRGRERSFQRERRDQIYLASTQKNEAEGSAQKTRQQAVLYRLYSCKSTGRTSAFNAGSRTAAQKSIFVLAD